MGWTGRFEAKNLPVEWAGYQGLAELMELRLLTNRQAQVILLYCRGFGPTQSGKILGTARQDVNKALRVGVKHLVAGNPVLIDIRRRWAKALLHCYANRRGGCSNATLIFDGHGQLVSLRAKVVTADDFETWREKENKPWEARRAVADLDLFAELLAALYANQHEDTFLQSLIPNEPEEDPEEMILRRQPQKAKIPA
jgi:hypothetical protein